MIITFKSQASGDVIMFGDVARHMMSLFGKDASDKGTLTVGELPAAISRLQAAIATGKEAPSGRPAEGQSAGDIPSEDDHEFSVTIAQRAVPLLQLFEESLQGEVPVVWGV